MQFFRDVSLRAKLSGSFAAVIVMFSVAVFVGWSSIGSVAGTVRAGYAAGIAAEAASAAAYNMHVSELQNVADGGKVLAMHQQDEAAFADALAGVRSAARSAAERAGVQNVDTAYADWKPLDDRVIAEARRGDTRSAAVLVDGAANSASDALSQRLDALSKLFRSAADSRSASSQLRARTLMLVIALVALLSTAAIAFLIVRSIKRTVDVILNRLTSLCENGMTWLADGLQAFARGDLTLGFTPFTPPIEHPSNDELGQIAAKVNVVREKMRTAVFAYNETAERLRETIGQVAQTAGSVSSSSQEMAVTSQEAGRATGEIAHAVGDVARGAERQVRMVEAARRAAEDVARAVGEAAQSAGQAAEVAHGTRQTAKDGVDAAAQANQAMTSVRDSSQAVSEAIRELAAKSDQIGHIVETITAIAEQTNLLALNAAIEAARAGEQGRGFAVVAEEVRKLAEDSQSAAQEISVLIGAIQSDTTRAVAVVEGGAQRTQDGAAVVERTREAFAQIESSVDDMTGRIEQIAAASQQIDASAQSMQNSIAEVAAVAEQSSASTEEVSASTEQTTASTEEIAASAQQLSGNAETLNSLVSRFKLSAG